jgi:hypothetical protein
MVRHPSGRESGQARRDDDAAQGRARRLARFRQLHRADVSQPGGPEGKDLVEKQYAAKPNLRPIYDAIVSAVSEFGPDVDIVPKQATVSLRRSKQFGLVSPATKSRVDVGINLKGEPGGERLKAIGGMCTHTVGVTHEDEVDDELLGWLREAFERA